MDALEQREATRRDILKRGGLALAAAWLAQGPRALADQNASGEKKDDKEKPEAEDVLPAEDLMREHGVLSRVLLIYDDARRKLMAGNEFPPEALASAAGIVQHFIEDYHEKNEENFLFPRFEKAGKLADLTGVLRAQHAAGRKITAYVTAHARPESLKDDVARREMAGMLQRFTRMYRPHKAREDTVLFPAIRSVVSAKEYDEMGDKFEDVEHERFGPEGFKKIVNEVAGLEKKLGLYDLAQFTPE